MKQAIKSFILKLPFTEKILKKELLIDALVKKTNDLNYSNTVLEKKNIALKKSVFNLNQLRYNLVLQKLKKRIELGKKIRVCFFVTQDSLFSYEPLYKLMLQDPNFEPFIVITPDSTKGVEHLITSQKQTYLSLARKYRDVFKGYDVKEKEFVDFSDKTDLVHFSVPYSGITHSFYEIDHFLDKDILPFYISYSYSVTSYFREKIKLDAYSYFWKIFIENEGQLDELKKYQIIEGRNAVVTGYCKMDALAESQIRERKRKVIIIAPHHTVENWKLLKISNFFKYADFFIDLPKLYPDIDFVFRPHPLLIPKLSSDQLWGKEKTNEYINKLASFPNLTLSLRGNYFDIFMNSDAIIHDCGSFLAEYLFTKKPACYILKSKESIDKWFMPIGKKCIKSHYKAFSKNDIIRFIDRVVMDEIDPLKSMREEFANKDLKINYPNVAGVILANIKNSIEKS